MHAPEPPLGDQQVSRSLPGVSVVLPVFNGGSTMRQAIESLLHQEGVDLELIVVDDGSVDDTPAVLATYRNDPRVRALHQPTNMGLVTALNRGVAAATHELVARLDADDVALPGRLAHQSAAFEADPLLVLHATAYQRTLPDGTVLRTPWPPLTHGGVAMAAWRGNEVCHSAIMFRRTAVLSVGGYRQERYPAEDFDLWLRLLRAGTYAGSSFVGTRYLVNPDGISVQHTTTQQAMVGRIVDEQAVAYCGHAMATSKASARARLRHLAQFRRALHTELRERGIPADGVDAMAYRLAMASGDHLRPIRHVLAACWTPALWFAGQRLSRHELRDGRPNDPRFD